MNTKTVSVNLRAWCDQALKFSRAGNLAETERLCLQILQQDRNNFIGLHVLGQTRAQQGRNAEALQLIGAALTVDAASADARTNYGRVLQNMGRAQEALQSYDAVLAANPKIAGALIARGVTLWYLRRFEEALASYDRALEIGPKDPSAWYNRGTVLADLQRFSDAIASYDRAIRLSPQLVQAHVNRGGALMSLGLHAEALAGLDKALALSPDFLMALAKRGNVLWSLGRFHEALASYDKALAIQPNFPMVLAGRGNALRDMGRFEEALASYDRALALQPNFPELLGDRGNVLRELKRLDEAIASYERALALSPNNADLWTNLGIAFADLKRLPEALASYERALAIQPNFIMALINRAITLRDARRFGQAMEDLNRALAIQPDNIHALYHRGWLAWSEYRRYGEALRDMEKACAIDRTYDLVAGDVLHLKMYGGDWRDFDRNLAALNADVRAGRFAARPFVYQALSASPADLQISAAAYADVPVPGIVLPAAPRANGKIRVGYLSGEFYAQATAYLAAGLYELHDRDRFEIVALDNGQSDGSPMRARLEAAFDKFVDIWNLSDRVAAERIRAEGIDILVSLNGYFGRSRSGVFAHRAAPVQVNYLGFPGTLGAPYMDYIIADRTVIPEDERQFFTEKVVYLPDSYQVNDAKRIIAAETPSRADYGLPENAFVFCNFNQSYKLLPATFAAWMSILKQTEGSVLWLLAFDDAYGRNLQSAAAAHGVAGERLIFAEPIVAERHLARLRLADLFLDSLPYNAHTTAADALWAGLPLVTCRGKAFAGRVAASLLQAAGLPELVTQTPEEFESLAVALARDPARLADLRAKLARNRGTCALFDTDRFRRNIESAYTTMIEIAHRGEAPQSFSV